MRFGGRPFHGWHAVPCDIRDEVCAHEEDEAEDGAEDTAGINLYIRALWMREGGCGKEDTHVQPIMNVMVSPIFCARVV